MSVPDWPHAAGAQERMPVLMMRDEISRFANSIFDAPDINSLILARRSVESTALSSPEATPFGNLEGVIFAWGRWEEG